MRQVEFTVRGAPVPQGSKSIGRTKSGKSYLYEQQAGELRAWRRAVRDEAEKHRVSWIRQSPLEVRLLFVVRRPPLGKFDGDPAPVAPDIDKLTRAVLDALTQGKVLVDDAQVVRLLTEKRYGSELGVRITVRDVGRWYPASVESDDEEKEHTG